MNEIARPVPVTNILVGTSFPFCHLTSYVMSAALQRPCDCGERIDVIVGLVFIPLVHGRALPCSVPYTTPVIQFFHRKEILLLITAVPLTFTRKTFENPVLDRLLSDRLEAMPSDLSSRTG